MPYFTLALVTGATSGIGKALCYLLAQEGVNLIITGRNQKALDQIKRELEKQVAVELLAADLNQPADRLRLIEWIHQFVPDLIINNAGFGFYGEALTHPTSEQLKILEVNGMAVLELTLEAARTLISKGKKGTILNVSSAAAFQLFPQVAVYAASKAFVNHVSQSLDFELQPYGVRVLAACPGMVATEFQERAGSKADVKKEFGVMSADYVARQIWQQIQQQKPLLIMNWRYRFLTYLSYLFPKRWVARVVGQKMASRIPPRRIITIDS